MLLAVIVAMNAFLCLILLEMVSRRGKTSVLIWFFNQPIMFSGTFALIFCAEWFLVILFNHPAPALVVGNALCLFPAVVNYYKIQLRGEYFVLPDLLAADVALDVLPGYTIQVTPLLVFAFLILLVAFPVIAGVRRVLTGALRRLIALLVALACLVAACFAFVHAPVDSIFFLPGHLYNNSGTLRTMYETRMKKMELPEGYSKEAVLSILDGYGQIVTDDTVKPDIFFIMSESLFDLVGTGQIEATADPLEGLRALQLQYDGCNTLCHSYGGGTFDAEYELLTGYRAVDTPGNISADSLAVQGNMDTLVTMLRDMGYGSVAVHPNRANGYNRLKNYTKMGFERTLFKEDLPEFQHMVGKYPADEELFERVIEDYEERDTSRPWLYHIVTFQNHGGYDYSPDRTDIQVLNRKDAEKRGTENYLNGELSHVEAVEKLIDYLENRGKPAVVLLWGDHAPNMANFAVDIGSGSKSAPFYETPVLIWNNFGADISCQEPRIAMYRLGAYVLWKLGLCKDAYMAWLAESGTPDMLTPLQLLETDTGFYQDETEYEKMDETLRILHYDRLFGEKYGQEGNP